MKSIRACLVFLSLLILIVTGCSGSSKKNDVKVWMEPNGRTKVLCTTQMVADLVTSVAGDLVDCYTLIRGASDPHSYQLVKGDDEKLARADVLFYSGLGLEHGPSLAQYLHNNSKAFALGDYVLKMNPEKKIIIDGVVDPHVWMDVSLWAQSLDFIAEILIKKIPQHKERLASQAENSKSQLRILHSEIISRMNGIPLEKRYLVTTHDAFNYYVRAYFCNKLDLEKNPTDWQERCQAPEGLAPDSQISTVELQKLVDHIIKYDVRVIFSESNVSQDSLRKLLDALKQKGFEVKIAENPLYADAMGAEGSAANPYQSMLRYDSQVIAKELLWNPFSATVMTDESK